MSPLHLVVGDIVCSSIPNYTQIAASCRLCGANNLKFGRILKLNILRWLHLPVYVLFDRSLLTLLCCFAA